MKIKKGDNVIVTAGKDRGREGKIIRVLPKENKVVIEGLNLFAQQAAIGAGGQPHNAETSGKLADYL